MGGPSKLLKYVVCPPLIVKYLSCGIYSRYCSLCLLCSPRLMVSMLVLATFSFYSHFIVFCSNWDDWESPARLVRYTGSSDMGPVWWNQTPHVHYPGQSCMQMMHLRLEVTSLRNHPFQRMAIYLSYEAHDENELRQWPVVYQETAFLKVGVHWSLKIQ